jgi:methionyl-tRNA formyltransferase
MYTLAFFGTSSFAVPLLQRLAADTRFQVVVVGTQPDRPVGRKHLLTPPPVKEAALALGLPVFQPERMRSPEALEALRAYSFDAAVVASYGQILPQAVLELAPQRWINLHGSILPRYRGASPIAEAIKQGDDVTGITVMIMDALMDHGPTLSTATTPILPTDTTETLSATLAQLGAEHLPTTLFDYLEGHLTPQEQDHAAATPCALLRKDDGAIDPATMEAVALERLIRAYTPWPRVSVQLAGQRVQLLRAHVGSEAPGALSINGKTGTLIIDELRPEGKAAMSGEAFLRGRRA